MTLRKRLIALSMAAACAATAFAGAAFTDQSSIKVDSKVIDTLTEKNVIKGFEDGSFQPDKLVTRAQMAKMMFVLRTGSDDASYYAKDMTDTFAAGTWSNGYVKYCQAYGIVSGKSSTVFAPNASVTTAEAAKMLLVYSGHDVQKDGLTGAQWKENTLKLADAEGLLTCVTTKPDDALPRQCRADDLQRNQQINTQQRKVPQLRDFFSSS